MDTNRSSTTAIASSEAARDSPTDEEILRRPWKYIGYKGYSSFLASEDEFFIIRRFDVLNVRISLSLQDELSVLEDELSKIDREYSKRDAAVVVNNGTLRPDQQDRVELLNKIERKIRHYNEFVLQQTAMRKYSAAPRRVVKSIRNWHYNYDHAAINQEEQKYLDFEKDLISVTPRDKTPIRQLIDNSHRLRTLAIWRQKDTEVPDHGAAYVSYYSDKRMDEFASSFIVTAGVIMLIVPLWILQSLESPTYKLVVITLFIFAFLLTLSFAMAAKPFEALGATAAYAAVLMVFLQFGDSSS